MVALVGVQVQVAEDFSAGRVGGDVVAVAQDGHASVCVGPSDRDRVVADGDHAGAGDGVGADCGVDLGG